MGWGTVSPLASSSLFVLGISLSYDHISFHCNRKCSKCHKLEQKNLRAIRKALNYRGEEEEKKRRASSYKIKLLLHS